MCVSVCKKQLFNHCLPAAYSILFCFCFLQSVYNSNICHIVHVVNEKSVTCCDSHSNCVCNTSVVGIKPSGDQGFKQWSAQTNNIKNMESMHNLQGLYQE